MVFARMITIAQRVVSAMMPGHILKLAGRLKRFSLPTVRGDAQIIAAMKQRAERLELVNEISMAINLRSEFEEVLQAAVDGLTQALDVGQTGLALFNERRTKLVIVADHPAPGVASGIGLEIPVEGNLSMERVLATGRPLVIADAQHDPLLAGVHPLMKARQVQSILIAPLLVRNEVIGTIGCDATTAPRVFSAEDVRLAQTIANLIAARIDLARAFDAEHRRRQEIEAVHRASLSVAASLDLSQVLEAILHALLDLVAATSAAIFLYDNTHLTFGLGITREGIMPTPYASPRPNGLTYTVARGGEAIFVEETARHPLFSRVPAEWGHFAIAGLPLKIGENVVGVMNVAYPEPHVFADSEMRMLSLLATQAAIAVQNARLHGEIQRHAQALEQRVAQRTAELEEERSWLQAVLDAAGDAIYFTDADKLIRYANPATQRITGYAPDELVGKPGGIWRGPTASTVIEAMEATVAQSQTWHGEVINQRKDGSLYHASLSLSPIRDATGRQTLGYVGLQRDITQAKELARLREHFVSRIGHELRTPLSNVHLYLDLLQRGQPEKQQQYAAALRLAATQMSQLIEGFLEFSRLIAEQDPDELRPTDLNRLAADCVRAGQALALERGLCLEAELDQAVPLALADPVMVYEVLKRLVANALDYTPAGGRVTVVTVRPYGQSQEWVALKVADTGPGISAEEMTRLFEPFFRGQAAADYTVPGAGLGLAICHEIVQKLGGTIAVENQPKTGTAFTVYLKAVEKRDLEGH